MTSPIYTLYDVITIENSNVGIGTASPQRALHVQGGIMTTAIASPTGVLDMTGVTISNLEGLSVNNLLGTDYDNIPSITTSNLGVNTIAPFTNSGFIDFSAASLCNIGTTVTEVITSVGTHISLTGKSLSNITDLASSSITTSTINSSLNNINVSGKSLSNVAAVSVVALTSGNDYITASGKGLCNVSTLWADTVKTAVLTSTTSNIDVDNKTLSNVTAIRVGTVEQNIITSTNENINVSGKSLSNVAAVSVVALTSDNNYITASGKGLCNVSTLWADTVKTAVLTSTTSNIDVDNKTLSNVTAIRVGTVEQNIITSANENINVSGKTLSNVAAVSVVALTSDNNYITTSGKGLCNVSTLWANTLQATKLTSTTDDIDVDGKTLSNVSIIRAGTVYQNVINSSNLNIDVSGKTLSNLAAVSVVALTSANDYITASGKGLCNVSTLWADTLKTAKLTSAGTEIDVDGKTLCNVGTLITSTITSSTSAISFANSTLSGVNALTVTSNVNIGGTLYTSNLQVIGDYTVMNTLTSNTAQFTITNEGTGPALYVSQTGVGSQFSIAEFVDFEEGMAMRITDTGLVGIGTTNPASRLAINGGVSVGSNYTTVVAPTNGMIVSGNLGIGVTNPSNKLGVSGAASIGSSYATIAAPANGLIVSGNVGFGTSAPVFPLEVVGTSKLSGLVVQTQNSTQYLTSMNTASFTATGNKTIGFTVSWTNTVSDQKLSFRVTARVHFTSDTNTTYSTVDAVITPVDSTPKPNGLLIGTPLTVAQNTNNFRNIAMTGTRDSATSVQLNIAFQANLSPCNAFLFIDIIAPTALGAFTFTPTNTGT